MTEHLETVIITAGGIGKRMNSAIPKQFIELKGTPVLMHTILRFYEYNSEIQIIITLPTDWLDYWKELCLMHDFTIQHQLVDGGKERYDSIKNALEHCKGDAIGVHDGVRPLVSIETIKECFNLARLHKASIPFLPMKESIRKLKYGGSLSAKRNDYITVQTPQCFDKALLIRAYGQEFHSGITDDASLVEQLGVIIRLVPGNEENMKITTPVDLKIAELLI
jgi:2-C-methyl-D-erythritol 4-phosphate cytidylyltransferase